MTAAPAVPPRRRRWKVPLLALRAWPPVNLAATSFGRLLVRTAGVDDTFLVRHLPRVGLVETTLPDGRVLKLWSHGDEHIPNLVYWRGWSGYEPETTPVFYRLAREARTVLDVGAYVGFHSVLAGLANPRGRVHGFEPLPAAFARLESNVALNRLHNVQCESFAAADYEGRAELMTEPGLPTSSTLAPGFLPPSDRRSAVEVAVRPLDRYVQERGLAGIDLVKIDTETTEPAVVRGLSRTLERDRPDIVCEVLSGQGTGPALEAALRPLGYRFYLLTPAGPEPVPALSGHPRWLNHLLTARPAEDLRRLLA